MGIGALRFRFKPGKPIVVVSQVQGPGGVWKARLILDTGATSTLLGVRGLEEIGIGARSTDRQVPLTTASGVVYAPKVELTSLSALGVSRRPFLVTAHTLPPSSPFDGLLGLDFLVGLRLVLDMQKGELIVEA